MYLVDTNVWLERLLDQEKAEEVGSFFGNVSSDILHITDFSFHSIGVILSRLKRTESLLPFARDVFTDGSVNLIHLEPDDTDNMVQVIQEYSFDFDDSYQYVAAEKYDLTLVSFDSDFDRTGRGRKTPADALK